MITKSDRVFIILGIVFLSIMAIALGYICVSRGRLLFSRRNHDMSNFVDIIELYSQPPNSNRIYNRLRNSEEPDDPPPNYTRVA